MIVAPSKQNRLRKNERSDCRINMDQQNLSKCNSAGGPVQLPLHPRISKPLQMIAQLSHDHFFKHQQTCRHSKHWLPRCQTSPFACPISKILPSTFPLPALRRALALAAFCPTNFYFRASLCRRRAVSELVEKGKSKKDPR